MTRHVSQLLKVLTALDVHAVDVEGMNCVELREESNPHVTQKTATLILKALNGLSLVQAGGAMLWTDDGMTGWFVEYSCELSSHLTVRRIRICGFDDRFFKAHDVQEFLANPKGFCFDRAESPNE